MTVRSSRLATDLEAAANAASDPFEAACLRADLAAQWARLGRLAEAEQLLSSLREKYRQSPHQRLTPWLNFGESMLDLGSNRVPEAMVKMRRAHALAVAGNVEQLAPLAAATLAHMYWNAQDVDVAVRLTNESFELSRPQDFRSRCGGNLLLGEMLGISGESAAGVARFIKCRRYASATGDTASMSALNFNSSVVALATLRQGTFEFLDSSPAFGIAAIQRAASFELDQLFSLSVDEGMTLLQVAQLHSLTNKPEPALAAYLRLERTNLASGKRQRAVWLADQAWCEMRLGHSAAALAKASSAIAELGQVVHIDDLAITHSCLALVFQSAGDADRFEHHRREASSYWGQYRAFQKRTAELCLAIPQDD